ncbi:MAG: IS30 family transposase, partial [Gordonia sp. (in: high G+C Gram-positive bacteria)]
MSFQEDCARLGDELVRLVDSGVPAKEAAVAVGVSRQRCYAILRAMGRSAGRPRGSRRPVDPE